MKLVRLTILEKFRSLDEVKTDQGREDFTVIFRDDEPNEEWMNFHPYCFAGLNGSGKSNVLEALSNIFYYLECCTLDPETSEFLKNDFKKEESDPIAYELEYFIIPREADKRKEFSTGRTIKTRDWNSKTGKVIGNSNNSKSINLFLESIRTKLFESYTTLFNSNKAITSESLINNFLGIETKTVTLLEAFGDHNDQIEKLIGNGYAKGTWERYETSLRHVQEFLMGKYNISDINLSELTPSCITNFDFFLRTVRKCANNSTVKYIRNLQKIVNICLDNEWMSKNPFTNYKSKIISKEVRSLTEMKLERIKNKIFSSERLRIVKDVFLFCCYTGLAYAEVKKLESQNIVTRNGKKIIKFKEPKQSYMLKFRYYHLQKIF